MDSAPVDSAPVDSAPVDSLIRPRSPDGLPGPAAKRKYGARSPRVAAIQLLCLVLAAGVVAAITAFEYRGISYESPPTIENRDSPAITIDFPARPENLTFRVSGTTTWITADFRDWSSPEEVLRIQSLWEQAPVRVFGLKATVEQQSGPSEATWTRVNSAEQAEGGKDEFDVQFAAVEAGIISQLSLAIQNGSEADSAQYRFLRTGRVDITGEVEDLPDEISGTLEIDTGAYSIDRPHYNGHQ